MIKKLVLVFIAVFAINSYGQEGTTSPYSFYGIGSLKFKGTVENRSMGGLSIYSDSIHVNLRNPAGYAGKNLDILNGESRPVKFTVGGSFSNVTLKSNSGSDKASSATFDYLALSVPMGKFGFGFGLIPYTSVGYKLETLDDNYDDGRKSNRFNGEGGLNKAFLGFGYQVNEKLSVGIDVQYNFGNIQNSFTALNYDDDGDIITSQTRENNRSDLSGLNVNLGLSYKTMISTNLELVSGLTYTPKANLGSQNTRSFTVVNTLEPRLNRTTEVDLEALGLLETDLVLPSKFSVGAGIGKPRKWFVGIESEYQQTSEFSNDLYTSSAIVYKNASSVSLGGFYIPQYNSFTSYLKRAVYRAGLHYENTGLNIENESINEFGISFGVGLPVGSFFSNANLGMELGRRGTTNSNLIQENFVNFQISLSLNDRWFQKRKYD
ncbi:outer membrane protein transport protein [Mariniflexile gromovii]|uniref:Outer membrane protein transport protein n=1 Tax=Mariniflexile gromovii TaxID=362523 RepID=A0ABS4BZG4_9FLAO|nr:outer membrane protein transport protein [Mariniflexile gromovii]MBP0905486.1 outer membrane protein transport protein [Mariniflexile gromovii]